MRISREQARENRERILAASSRLFREEGIEGVAVGDLMRAAGLTHGGFYNHFPSKGALAAEAVGHAFGELEAERSRSGSLEEILRGYLSRLARDHPGQTCPAASISGDVSRQPGPVREAFGDGLEAMAASIGALLPPGDDRRGRALAMISQMAGAVMLSRAVPDDSPLADDILQAALINLLSQLDAGSG